MEFARRLRQDWPEIRVLLTDTSDASVPGLPHGIDREPAPSERSRHVRAFLEDHMPALGLWTECDLRAELLVAAHDMKIPLLMADAHTARPDPRPWRWRRGTGRGLMERFAAIHAGDEATRAALRRIGGEGIAINITGFIEEGPPALPCDDAERANLALQLGGRPIWFAAGLPMSECDAVIDAALRALQRSHRMLLILSPLDLGDAPAMEEAFQEAGLLVARRSEGADPSSECQVYLADTEDELGLWYRLSPIAFLGNSLIGQGGRDPFEAAALGSAIIHGPNVSGYRHGYSRLASAGATRLVRNAVELGAAVETLLAPDVAAAMAQAAWRVATTGAEVTDLLIEEIVSQLEITGAL